MISLVAPAKLTVSLRVTGVRDDGHHLLDAEMVCLDLHDTLHLVDADRVTVRATGPAAPPGGLGDDDLVARALRLVDRTAAVEIDKQIPTGAGLGGGSADAAAVLRWAGGVGPDDAVRLGADVAFCLVGGRARVRGIGDLVEPLPHIERVVTLLTPPLHCSTPAVYRRWDELGGPSHDSGNDLEPAALDVYPELASWRDRMVDLTGAEPRLAGSGSTWWVDGAFEGPGLITARTIPAPI
ncbi:MAG TPA: 4-(cytidine 5'-diphospho)-2-C-methyl-D-erythritol kinase [Microthrixaceae bacterium]|nr:4-(cytidine 5'-diphospho)-2-C-methyl-D-erythritol kinase [Microthrixaceae bacterium]